MSGIISKRPNVMGPSVVDMPSPEKHSVTSNKRLSLRYQKSMSKCLVLVNTTDSSNRAASIVIGKSKLRHKISRDIKRRSKPGAASTRYQISSKRYL
jgi:hypothetical protein